MAPVVNQDQDHVSGGFTNGILPPIESAAAQSRLLTREPESYLLPNNNDKRNHGPNDDHAASNDIASSTTSPISVTSPPYWLNPNSHQRSTSSLSAESILPIGVITLRDNDTNDDDRSNACWAKSVEIIDYTMVNGGGPNIGAFVVWNVRVETLSGSYMNIRKRYSEFDDFRRKLIVSFPNFTAAVPELPPKSVIFKFRPNFLEKRRAGLQYFLNCILLNPEFSGSPVLKEFLFA